MASLKNLKKRNCSQRMSRMSLSIIQIFLQNLVLKSYQHHHYHLLPFFLFLFFFLFSIVIIINIIIIVIRRTFQVIFKELSYHSLFYFALTFFWKCLGIITFTRFENRINHYCWEKKRSGILLEWFTMKIRAYLSRYYFYILPIIFYLSPKKARHSHLRNFIDTRSPFGSNAHNGMTSSLFL